MKKKRIIIAFGIVMVVLCSAFSFLKFDTLNFIRSGTALLQISVTEKDFVIIKETPTVILANADSSPYDLLMNYMNSNDYDFNESLSVASTLVFERNNTIKYVSFSVNRYYSKWVIKDTE